MLTGQALPIVPLDNMLEWAAALPTGKVGLLDYNSTESRWAPRADLDMVKNTAPPKNRNPAVQPVVNHFND
jgi:hypothetical protein